MVQQILLVCGLALCWHLAIGYWAMSTVSRVRKSARVAERHVENLVALQRVVFEMERDVRALAAIEQRRQQQETTPGFGPEGRGPCTCNGDADEEWIRRGNAEHLP
jgi:type II secretory pathway component PulJ